jgi:hypothetical protein
MGLFVHREHHRTLGRVEIKPHDNYYYYRQPGSGQLTDRQLFKFAGGFQHHPAGRRRAQPLD